MPNFHRVHVDAHAGRPVRRLARPEPLRFPRQGETSAEAEIATFLRAFAVFFLVMVVVVAFFALD